MYNIKLYIASPAQNSLVSISAHVASNKRYFYYFNLIGIALGPSLDILYMYDFKACKLCSKWDTGDQRQEEDKINFMKNIHPPERDHNNRLILNHRTIINMDIHVCTCKHNLV